MNTRYCPEGCFFTGCDVSASLAKFTQSDVDPNVEYVTAAFLFCNNSDNHEAIRGKEVFVKTAVLVDYARSNVVLNESVHGFMIDSDTHIEPLHYAINEVIGRDLLIERYEVNEDPDDESDPPKYNYIYPNSDRSLEVVKLMDKILFNVVNMETVESFMPNMPRDVRQCVVDKMWQDPIINVPAVDPRFIAKRVNVNSRKSHRNILCEWFQESYSSRMKSYLDEWFHH